MLTKSITDSEMTIFKWFLVELFSRWDTKVYMHFNSDELSWDTSTYNILEFGLLNDSYFTDLRYVNIFLLPTITSLIFGLDIFLWSPYNIHAYLQRCTICSFHEPISYLSFCLQSGLSLSGEGILGPLSSDLPPEGVNLSEVPLAADSWLRTERSLFLFFTPWSEYCCRKMNLM